jgi:hypothetical protein
MKTNKWGKIAILLMAVSLCFAMLAACNKEENSFTALL